MPLFDDVIANGALWGCFATWFVSSLVMPALHRASRVIHDTWWYRAENGPEEWAFRADLANRSSLIYRTGLAAITLDVNDADDWLEEQGFIPARDAQRDGLIAAAPKRPFGFKRPHPDQYR